MDSTPIIPPRSGHSPQAQRALIGILQDHLLIESSHRRQELNSRSCGIRALQLSLVLYFIYHELEWKKLKDKNQNLLTKIEL